MRVKTRYFTSNAISFSLYVPVFSFLSDESLSISFEIAPRSVVVVVVGAHCQYCFCRRRGGVEIFRSRWSNIYRNNFGEFEMIFVCIFKINAFPTSYGIFGR